VAAPEPIPIAPVFPALLDPELKYKAPLAPDTPAFKLRTTTVPLVVVVPSPEEIRTEPPVTPVLGIDELRPALTKMSPPIPLVPLPTLTTMAPARPAVAVPEPRYTAPLLPVTELPVLK
jgi:hypothetical protein